MTRDTKRHYQTPLQLLEIMHVDTLGLAISHRFMHGGQNTEESLQEFLCACSLYYQGHLN
jgi:hypothetical protein